MCITHHIPDNDDILDDLYIIEYGNGKFQAVLYEMYSALYDTIEEAIADVINQYEEITIPWI